MASINKDILETDPALKKTKIIKALESEDLSVSFIDALDNEMILNMGPQHPATHGVLRLLISLDGETIVKCIPELGYLHRGYEKLAESSTYHEFIPHTDRLDYLSPMANNVGYALAVEKLIHLEIPERGQYIRVIIAELARIQSHLLAVGAMVMDIGALTPFLWAIREREKILDLYDVICGARFTTSYTRIGGVAQDMTDESLAGIKKFTDEFISNLNEIRDIVERNKIFIERCEGIGHLPKEECIEL
nr:NADH-quinone oxidoreductase subunit D [Ignavibacteria bacterium]